MQKRQESTKNVKKCGTGGRSASKVVSAAKKAKKSNPAGKREDFLEFQPRRQTPPKAQTHNKKKKNGKSAGAAKDFAAMDIAVAFTGLLVLIVAVFTTGIYLKSVETARQREAVAAVGAKLEQIGTAGEEILSAVAKEREAAEEAGDVSASEPAEYEEKSWKRIWIWH